MESFFLTFPGHYIQQTLCSYVSPCLTFAICIRRLKIAWARITATIPRGETIVTSDFYPESIDWKLWFTSLLRWRIFQDVGFDCHGVLEATGVTVQISTGAFLCSCRLDATFNHWHFSSQRSHFSSRRFESLWKKRTKKWLRQSEPTILKDVSAQPRNWSQLRTAST